LNVVFFYHIEKQSLYSVAGAYTIKCGLHMNAPVALLNIIQRYALFCNLL
jgi:hypothetical protein